MRAVQGRILAAVVGVLGVVGSASDARAQDARQDGSLGREEVYRQVTSAGGAIYHDTAATRGDRGDLWGSPYAGTYILAVVVRQPTPDGAGILYVYDPARTCYRAAVVFDNYDPSCRLSGQQAAAYHDATQHLYPAPGGDQGQAAGGNGPGSTAAPVEQPPTMGERLGRNVAAFRTSAGGGDALFPVALTLIAASVLVGAVATALVVVVPVLSSALARHRAISQAGHVLHNLRTGGRR